ncbi:MULTISPECIES: hypothetical protein [Lactobacillus]|uniref:hypothetical protein n=1 Tax=Lactobacillus TaxID=1578 RepID=UPI002490991B|nr:MULTISPECIES: hypothetical protein [Lactobacillus]
MLSFLLVLFLLWLFFKLGIGIIKIIGFLIVVAIIAAFFAYLLIPLLALLAVGGLVFAAMK